MGCILMLPPLEKRNWAAMSSSPWERAWEGNEDVAAPFDAGALSGCTLLRCCTFRLVDGWEPGQAGSLDSTISTF